MAKKTRASKRRTKTARKFPKVETGHPPTSPQTTMHAKLRVFMSSTVYDLIDVRSEVAAHLTTLGVIPVLSDDKLSDFHVPPDRSSIETCLVNVASCQEVIVILDRRYGPRLGAFGYDDISATHLEYRKAIELRIPVHMYVRDRLDAEFSIWKRNGRSDSVALTWIDRKDFGLFELLEEHSRLKDPSSSNWYSSFSNSVDLKAAIEKHFKPRILPQRLIEAIQSNAFPMFELDLEVQHQAVQDRPALKFAATLTNVGGAPAFNFRVHWDGEDAKDMSPTIVAAGQSTVMTFIYGLGGAHQGATRYLIAEYESPIGVAVCDRFTVHGQVKGTVLLSGGGPAQRQFRRTPPLSLELDES